MELLAIAGIIGYGLYNSQEGREPRQDRNRYADILGSGNGVRDDYDTKPTDMVRKYRKKAEKRWKQEWLYEGEFPVLLESYNVKRPSLLFVKADDLIKIKFVLVFKDK